MLDDTSTFPDQHPNEHVIVWVHKHWIVYARTFLVVFIAGAIFPVVLTYVGEFLFSNTRLLGAAYLGVLILILYVWLWGFIQFIDEEFDCLILTNERIIDINQDGLFSIATSSSSLEHIDSTTGSASGMLGNVLNYGTVVAQTSAQHIVAELRDVDDPKGLAAILRETAEEHHRAHGKAGHSPTGDEGYDQASYEEEIEHA